jgi:hypothetical protein
MESEIQLRAARGGQSVTLTLDDSEAIRIQVADAAVLPERREMINGRKVAPEFDAAPDRMYAIAVRPYVTRCVWDCG